MTDKEFLQWIFNRLKNVHGENPNLDYMRKLKSLIDKNEWVRFNPSDKSTWPDNECKCLIVTKHRKTGARNYCIGIFLRSIKGFKFIGSDVTHWQPLP